MLAAATITGLQAVAIKVQVYANQGAIDHVLSKIRGLLHVGQNYYRVDFVVSVVVVGPASSVCLSAFVLIRTH